MAWIELHQTLPQNGKLIRLKRELRIQTPQAVGHLCLLWLWAVDNAPDGDLSRVTPEEIAEIAQYRARQPERLYEALLAAGFVDADQRLHNWELYTGRLQEGRERKRQKDLERQRKRRELLRDGGVTERDSHAPTIPYPTKPNKTIPYHPESKAKEVRQGGFVEKSVENCRRMPLPDWMNTTEGETL